MFEENSDKESYDYRGDIVFQNLRFQNNFRPHENSKPGFSNSPGLTSVFEKLYFLDGLMWTVGLNLEIKLRFSFIFSA